MDRKLTIPFVVEVVIMDRNVLVRLEDGRRFATQGRTVFDDHGVETDEYTYQEIICGVRACKEKKRSENIRRLLAEHLPVDAPSPTR